MSGNDHYRRFAAGGNGYEESDPRDAEIERLRQRVRELETNTFNRYKERVDSMATNSVVDEYEDGDDGYDNLFARRNHRQHQPHHRHHRPHLRQPQQQVLTTAIFVFLLRYIGIMPGIIQHSIHKSSSNGTLSNITSSRKEHCIILRISLKSSNATSRSIIRQSIPGTLWLSLAPVVLGMLFSFKDFLCLTFSNHMLMSLASLCLWVPSQLSVCCTELYQIVPAQKWKSGEKQTNKIPFIGKRTLKLPPQLGYSMRGAGCKGGSCIIPPHSVLFFDVEFIGKA
ncbi:FK506-binding protein [Artemisia annua]|uniref:peptidylprolyl isomerase n=1 Tax=Artemisia annua TaxID=35608 RepID=A0A2U1MLP8_ARTAN|nr:FK506-binding protein [Artemisia annua]